FHVVRLQDDAAVVRPIALQGEDQALERALGSHMGWQFGHGGAISRQVGLKDLPRGFRTVRLTRGTYRWLARGGSSAAQVDTPAYGTLSRRMHPDRGAPP